MADVAPRAEQPKMTIGKGWLFYFVALIVFILVCSIGRAATLGAVVIDVILYFVIGFVMNRMVLRGLIEWHPVYNTIENVSKGKLGMLLVWPVRYPILFFKLLVVKHL